MSDLTYTSPLSRGFNRMKALLFRPFNLVTWLTVGFAAFLSNVGESLGGSSISHKSDISAPSDVLPWLKDSFSSVPGQIALNSGYLILISAVLLAFLLLAVGLAWVEARAKFVLLDNVVRGRGAFQKPWSEYRMEGNSLFIWKLVIDIVLAVSIGFSLVLLLAIILPGAMSKEFIPFSVAGLFISLWIALLVVLVVAYLRLFIQDFIVPIMYKDRVGFTRAWSKFVGLLRRRPFELLLYGLFVAVLAVALCLLLGVLGLITCCVGFLVVAIPYVGTVILLPIHATYRAFSAEFLAQFGPEFDVWEGTNTDPASPQPLPEGGSVSSDG